MSAKGLYLGGRLDQPGGKVLEPWSYDQDDLTTHGLIVGMTGSGKTGLALVMLEEMLLARIPMLVLDPKGDLANLCFNFPELADPDLAPWLSPSVARREGKTVEEVAAATAKKWRDGLATWNVPPSRMAQLKDQTEVRIYTPGSTSGIPLDILSMLRSDPADRDNPEIRLDRVGGAVGALLGLVGIEADPLQSPEHILLSNILEYYWSRGQAVTLETLLGAVLSPPIQKLGIFPLEEFFPAPQRRKLAMTLNGVLAAPNFELWRTGAPLDVAAMLGENAGRTPCNIIYLAHLNDQERMFVVTTVLNELVAWMRRQQGSDALRALLYFDEIAGYIPPYPLNPASKTPLMMLLKQARAFGLGVLLATQNPVDVDYKAMTNTGSWFVGKLQAQGDKDRLMDGMELATGGGPSRREMDGLISSLSPRQFMVKNVHEREIACISSRWAMSYLAGPLSLPNVVASYDSGLLRRPVAAAPPAAVPGPSPAAPVPAAAPAGDPAPAAVPAALHWPQVFVPPEFMLLAELRERFPRLQPPGPDRAAYVPFALAQIRAVFDEERDRFEEERYFFRAADLSETAPPSDWANLAGPWHQLVGESQPSTPGAMAGFGPWASERGAADKLGRSAVEDVFREETLEIHRNPVFRLSSLPGESRQAFMARCGQQIEDELDRRARGLKERFRQRLERLEAKLQRAQLDLAHREDQLAARKRESLISAGESIVGFFLGSRSRRIVSSTLSKHRATGAAERSVDLQSQAVRELEKEIQSLQDELQEQLDRDERDLLAKAAEVESWPVRLEKSDIQVTRMILLWVPTRAD